MKKILVSLAVILLLSAIAFGGDIYTQRVTQTGSALITTGGGIIGGIVGTGDGTNAVTLTIRDGRDTGGSKMTPSVVFTGRAFSMSLDTTYESGIYVEGSSSGAYEYTVYFKSR
ncbi:MAG: hypothetical protein ACYDG4_13230 [Desulfuromonadaceae bacterium]